MPYLVFLISSTTCRLDIFFFSFYFFFASIFVCLFWFIFCSWKYNIAIWFYYAVLIRAVLEIFIPLVIDLNYILFLYIFWDNFNTFVLFMLFLYIFVINNLYRLIFLSRIIKSNYRDLIIYIFLSDFIKTAFALFSKMPIIR